MLARCIFPLALQGGYLKKKNTNYNHIKWHFNNKIYIRIKISVIYTALEEIEDVYNPQHRLLEFNPEEKSFLWGVCVCVCYVEVSQKRAEICPIVRKVQSYTHTQLAHSRLVTYKSGKGLGEYIVRGKLLLPFFYCSTCAARNSPSILCYHTASSPISGIDMCVCAQHFYRSFLDAKCVNNNKTLQQFFFLFCNYPLLYF